MSLRGRLLAASLTLLLLGLVVADVATFLALRSFLLEQTDSQLREAAVAIERASEGGRRGGVDGGPRGRSFVTVAPGVWVQVTDASGNVLAYSSGGEPGERRAAPALPSPLPTPVPAGRPYDEESGIPMRTMTVGSTAAGDGAAVGGGYRVGVMVNPHNGNVVTVALPLDDVEGTLRRLVVIELVVSFGVLALSAALGSWLVRVGLRPLDDIGDTAAEIAAGDLRRRVARDDERTEVGRLGHSLNEMLGQIETAFDERRRSEDALRRSEARLRQFVADASHELRTPIAAVQAYAELFERGALADPEDLERALRNVNVETHRMSALVDDLLLLTRLDQGRPLDHQQVDLGAIAADAVDASRVVDPDHPVTLEVRGLVEVRGDRLRLRQIVDNLLANVRIHTPPGTPTEVTVTAEGDVGVLSVADHGPGLAAQDADRAFERFYRADASRSRADGGSGLGLSIVQAIAVAHGGSVAVSETPGGGATFAVRVPLLDA